MDKDGNHDCGFEDCVSEKDKRYPDDAPFESYCSCYDCFQKMVKLENKLDKATELLKCALPYVETLAENSEMPDGMLHLVSEANRFLEKLEK
jgi:hypothetical protein